ncbi:MAG: preprotein translocase subunit SecE [Methylococcales bacterium]|jgi:preprotein translocase subunit SecE|nr:MAG: preprotein translocase subunit SecE [Methylococcales bacterium]
MNTNVETESPVLDIIKKIFSALIVVAAVSAFYYFSVDHDSVKEIRLLFRVLALVSVIVAVLGLMSTTNTGKFVLSFVLESKQEVRKVIWPTRDETMRTTLLVFAMVFIVGLILWVLDMFLFWGVRSLTGQG